MHGCVSALNLTTVHNRKLIARERPRDIGQGVAAASRVLSSTISNAVQSVAHTPCAAARRGPVPFLKQLGTASAQCLASPLTGALGGTAVLLSSIDRTTRMLAAGSKEAYEMQRTRPARLLSPQAPRLLGLQDRMVVRLQMVLESVARLQPLGYDGELTIKVELRSADTTDERGRVIDSHTTRPIRWPFVRVWEEVIGLKPDALDDTLVLTLSHRPLEPKLAAKATVVGEARLTLP